MKKGNATVRLQKTSRIVLRIQSRAKSHKFPIVFWEIIMYNSPCLTAGGYGGIGRRARFRFWWETVQVQVLLSAVTQRRPQFQIGTAAFSVYLGHMFVRHGKKKGGSDIDI